MVNSNMKVLFLSRWYPFPADNGSRMRVYHLIRQLASRHDVSLISFTSDEVSDNRLRAMQALCANVQTAMYQPFQPGRIKALLAFLSKRPRSVIDTHSVEMERLVEDEVTRFRPQVVIASQIDMLAYAHALPARRVLEEIEVSTVYDALWGERDPLKRLRVRLTWAKLTAYLRAMMQDYNGGTVVSREEYRRVMAASATRIPVAIVPNGIDAEACATVNEQPQADTLIYSGSLTYRANFDAVNYFLREIFPLILAKRPYVKLFITGKVDGAPLDALPSHTNVVFTGYLDDVRALIAKTWVSVVPLRIGGGTRLKILEALALGTPVVSTRKGAEGLELTPGQDILVADAPHEFAAAVLSVLQDATLRERLRSNGREVVAAKYDWSIIGRQFCGFVEEVGGKT